MADIPGIPTKITLQVVAPERALVNEVVDEVEIPGADGYFGVWPGHTPMLAALDVGTLWYRQGSEKHYLAIAYGFVEVQPDHVTVLARTAEKAGEIDLARAQAAKQRAESRMATFSMDVDFERARIALLKSLMRLRAAEQARMRS